MNASELLLRYAKVTDQLKKIGIIRTMNNPVSDYAEWLAKQNLNLTLEPNSKKGYDAIDRNNIKYQIKGRRDNSSIKKIQLGVIRKLEEKKFTYLIAIFFNKNFSLKKSYKIPHAIVGKYAKFSKHQNGHVLRLNTDILNEAKTEDITKKFKIFF